MDVYLLGLILSSLGGNGRMLDLASSYIQNGGDSLKAIKLASKLRAQGYKITREMILTCPTLGKLIETPESPAPEPASSASSSSPSSSSPETHASDTEPAVPDLVSLTLSKPILEDHGASNTLGGDHHGSTQPSPRPASTLSKESGPPDGITEMNGDAGAKSIKSRIPTGNEDLFTEMQLSMIRGTLIDSSSANMICYQETYHTSDLPAIKSAWAQAIRSESIFQASKFGVFADENTGDFNWIDVAESDSSDFEGLSRVANKYKGRIGSFFEAGPRRGVGQDGRDLSSVTWIVHHAFIDGYSGQLLFDKVRRLANGLKAPPGPSFWNWASGLKAYQYERKSDGNSFWASKSSQHVGSTGELLLPSPPSVPQTASTLTSCIQIDLDSFPVDIASTAREIGLTSAVTYYAAWALVLASYADSDNVVFGAVLGGRSLPVLGSVDVVGPTLNVLPLQIALHRSESALDFLRSLFRELLELEEFSWTTPDNGFTRTYESALSVQMSPAGSDKRNNLAIHPLEIATTQVSEVPISITVDEATQKIKIQYQLHRFSHENIARIAQCYSTALHQILLHPDLSIGKVMDGLLSPSSKDLLHAFGNCSSELTKQGSIKQDLVTLFEGCVRANSDAIAVDDGHAQLSYRDLDLAASRVADELLCQSIVPGDVVCVHADRTIGWITAILGVLKAGAVYCPLDSKLPPTLRESMYSLAGAKTFLTPKEAERTLINGAISFSVENILQEEINSDSLGVTHRQEPRPASPAYICFTSGSTGTPKGVLCLHEGLVAFEKDLNVRMQAAPGVRVAQIMSVAFDGCVHEVFSSLTHGATLVLPSRAHDPFAALDTAHVAMLTPTSGRVLEPEDYPNLKWVYLVGEPIPQDVSDAWASKKQVFNMYGPTEGTCGATIKQLRPGEMVTIGGPNPSTRIYILNSRGQLCQPGMIGEVCTAGIQVSQGYLNLPDQTRERFHKDEILGEGMMYQTGDRGYWNEAGEIVCLGRNDRQIKLRGYRLDMNDLEIRIARAVPELKGVAVARSGDELILLVRPVSTNTQDLRNVLSSVLPFYAVPQYIIATDRIATTPVGKVDYKAIVQQHESGARVGLEDETEQAALSPSITTPLEDLVATAWRVVLRLADGTRLDRRHSHFASLGGDSLSQIRLSSRLSSELGVRIPLQSIIAHPTVEGLAANLEELLASNPATATLASRREQKTLGHETVSPIEKEWLDRYQIGRGSESFNVSFAADFDKGNVDVTRLARAWDTALSRHRIFRCRYKSESQTPVKTYTDDSPRARIVASIDLRGEVNKPFDPATEPSVRVFISKDHLLVVMSHIVADYTTMSTLLKEVSVLYAHKTLGPVQRTYADVSVWCEPALASHQQFWDDYLGGDSPPTTGFYQRRPRDESAHDGRSSLYLFEEASWRKIEQYARQTNVTLQQMALGAVAVVLDRNPYGIDIVLGAPYMNRRTEEDAETVGLFLEPIPIRIRHGIQTGPGKAQHGTEPSPFMATVRQSVQNAVAHAMPWDQLLRLRDISPDSRPAFHPIFDVMVTFHDSDMIQSLAMPDLPDLRPRYVWSQGAKFKLMAEFVRVSEGRLLLRLEYDDSCLSKAEIKAMLRGIPLAMVSLAEGLEAQEIGQRLAARYDGRVGSPVDEDKVFGARFSEI